MSFFQNCIYLIIYALFVFFLDQVKIECDVWGVSILLLWFVFYFYVYCCVFLHAMVKLWVVGDAVTWCWFHLLFLFWKIDMNLFMLTGLVSSGASIYFSFGSEGICEGNHHELLVWCMGEINTNTTWLPSSTKLNNGDKRIFVFNIERCLKLLFAIIFSNTFFQCQQLLTFFFFSIKSI